MPEVAPPTASTPSPARAGKRRPARLIVVSLAGLLLAGGAGAGWYFLGREPAKPQKVEHKVAKKPLFTTLEPFTVNLQDPRGERFAQIGVTLQFDNPDVEIEIKDRLPALRNDVLMLISSKRVEDLLSMEGKQQLAQDIRLRAGRALGLDLPEAGASAPRGAVENPVRAVLFSQFIVQ
jgi:flagellar FliL protein